MFSNSWEWPRQIETCRICEKIASKNTILTLMHLLVSLCELFVNAETSITLRMSNLFRLFMGHHQEENTLIGYVQNMK
jgi:hypothetical protein